MTAWWWIILCIGMCAGQSPVLTPANETAAKYKQDKTLTCTYAPFASGNPFQLIFNSFIIYDHTGPAVGKESKYGIEKQSGLVTLTIRDVNISDSGEYVCNMAFKNSLPVNVSVWNEPDVSLTLNQGCPIVTARGIYPHESNLINFKSNYTSFATREVKGNTADSNLFDIVWTSKMKVDAGWFCVKISFDIYGNDLPHTRCDVYGPITSTAEPTTTIPTLTTTMTTTTSSTTDVQTTASTPSIPTAATSTVTATTMSALTTASFIVTVPTTSAHTTSTSIVTAPTTSLPTASTSIVTAPTTSASTTSTSTITAPTTSSPTTATLTMTAPTSPILSSTSSSTTNQSQNNNMDKVGYIIGGCIGGAMVVALLVVILFCLLRGPVCKGLRSKKPYETSKDPRAKNLSARHQRHGGKSHTRKQYDRPQNSRSPVRSFPNHFNNPAYVGPAGRSSGYHMHVPVSKPPSYSFYDPFSGEYVRISEQRGGHSVGHRYALYPQSQQRDRMQQTWYQPYTQGRPGFYDNSGNWDFYN